MPSHDGLPLQGNRWSHNKYITTITKLDLLALENDITSYAIHNYIYIDGSISNHGPVKVGKKVASLLVLGLDVH